MGISDPPRRSRRSSLVAFFAPLFDDERYFNSPSGPVEVSPLGIRPFFLRAGARIIANEMLLAVAAPPSR